MELGSLSRDELDAVEGDLGGVVEVIYNNDLVSILQKCQRCEGANVASSTAREMCQILRPFSFSSYSLNGAYCDRWLVGVQILSQHPASSSNRRKWEMVGAYPVIRTVPTGILKSI